MYMGILGRVANRIDGAQFTLDGVTYKTYPNDGNDTLHGGLAFSAPSKLVLGCSLR